MKFISQDPDTCDYCGQRPAVFPVAGVMLCRDCYARIVSSQNKTLQEQSEETQTS